MSANFQFTNTIKIVIGQKCFSSANTRKKCELVSALEALIFPNACYCSCRTTKQRYTLLLSECACANSDRLFANEKSN